jgi:hypothetical protein
MLVHTDPQDKPVIVIAIVDGENNGLGTFDLSSWQCVSQCTTPDMPWCLYESDGAAYLHCRDGSLHHISSVLPLTISKSPQGQVTVVEYYNCISHLGPGRLVAVSNLPPSVHVIDPNGRQLADLSTCGLYKFTYPCGVVCGGGRVVVTAHGEGSCLGREWQYGRRVVWRRAWGPGPSSGCMIVSDTPALPSSPPEVARSLYCVMGGRDALSVCPWRRAPWCSR